MSNRIRIFHDSNITPIFGPNPFWKNDGKDGGRGTDPDTKGNAKWVRNYPTHDVAAAMGYEPAPLVYDGTANRSDWYCSGGVPDPAGIYQWENRNNCAPPRKDAVQALARLYATADMYGAKVPDFAPMIFDLENPTVGLDVPARGAPVHVPETNPEVVPWNRRAKDGSRDGLTIGGAADARPASPPGAMLPARYARLLEDGPEPWAANLENVHNCIRWAREVNPHSALSHYEIFPFGWPRDPGGVERLARFWDSSAVREVIESMDFVAPCLYTWDLPTINPSLWFDTLSRVVRALDRYAPNTPRIIFMNATYQVYWPHNVRNPDIAKLNGRNLPNKLWRAQCRAAVDWGFSAIYKWGDATKENHQTLADLAY